MASARVLRKRLLAFTFLVVCGLGLRWVMSRGSRRSTTVFQTDDIPDLSGTTDTAHTDDNHNDYDCFCEDYKSYVAGLPTNMSLHLATRCNAMTDAWRQRFEAYIRFHTESMHRDPHTTKFLVAHATGGTGNRVFSLLSSFLLAVMTDRVFLVHREVETHIGLLFRRPCFEWLISDYLRMAEWHSSLSHTDSCSILITVAGAVRKDRQEQIRKLKCMDPRVTFQDCHVLAVSSHQYYAPMLFSNPFLRDSLYELIPTNIFQSLRGILFRPREEFLAHVRLGIQQLGFDPSHTMGIQLRTRMLAADTESVTEAPWILSFVACAERLMHKANLSHAFLATDRRAMQTGLQSLLDTTAVHVYFFRADVDDLGRHRSIAEEKRALVDMLTVASCSERMTTLMSTFGTVLRSFAQNLSFDGRACTAYDTYEAEFHLRDRIDGAVPCKTG